MNAAQASEADMWRGQLVSSTLQEYLIAPDGKLDPDKVATLSQTYALSGGPYESNYTLFVMSKLQLPDINFNLRIRTALQVTMRRTGDQVQVNVTLASSRTPVQALVKVYISDGTSVVGTYLGETAISGLLNFDISVSATSAVVAFASSGSSVGYAVMDGQGKTLFPTWDKGYVWKGKLQNDPIVNKIIFALEDWTVPQNNLIQTDGFSLPIVILWKVGNMYSFIEYPHLPSDYGAPLPRGQQREYRLTTIVRLGNSTFVWDARVWRG
jgi:hypothetical protein